MHNLLPLLCNQLYPHTDILSVKHAIILKCFIKQMYLSLTGFTGVTCETNKDDCAGKECHQGTCIDGVEEAFCLCPVGKVGSACDKGTSQRLLSLLIESS